jgi:hypothetical protein
MKWQFVLFYHFVQCCNNWSFTFCILTTHSHTHTRVNCENKGIKERFIQNNNFLLINLKTNCMKCSKMKLENILIHLNLYVPSRMYARFLWTNAMICINPKIDATRHNKKTFLLKKQITISFFFL